MLPTDRKGYGVHAGLRQLGILVRPAHAAPQACGGVPTTECHAICRRGCYLPDYIPTPPYRATGAGDGGSVVDAAIAPH